MSTISSIDLPVPAELPVRIAARGLDAAVVAAITVGLGLWIGFGFDWLVVGAAIILGYFVLLDALAGATLGKLVLGLRRYPRSRTGTRGTWMFARSSACELYLTLGRAILRPRDFPSETGQDIATAEDCRPVYRPRRSSLKGTLIAGDPLGASCQTAPKRSGAHDVKKVIDRGMEFILYKSGERYILSVPVDHGAVGTGLDILLDPGEVDSLLSNMKFLELKAAAMRNNPGLFMDEAVDLRDFE